MTLRSVGRYQLIEEIGRGSMGAVFRASDPLIERTVAVKTVELAKLDDGSLEPRLRFLREAKAAGRLSHPGIVTVHDVGEVDNVAFIVMEYVEGRSLKDVLDRGARVPLATAAEIVRQAAEALAAAHRQGVVHRDVKPGNVMLARAGIVKITDFGIARVDQSARTRTGVLVGSPGYMSPEQLSGREVDGRSDVFSLGSMLYELATGRGPFDAERPEDVLTLMTNIVSRPHAPARKVNPAVPEGLSAILERALQKDREQRFQSADEMASALKVALAREVHPVPGDPDIARLAQPADVLLPEFDIFADSTGTAPGAGAVSATAATTPAGAGAGSLLAKLKSEAEAIERTSAADQSSQRLMRHLEVERRMRAAFDFYQELVRYLAVVKPEAGYEYRLSEVGAFARPRVADAFVDAKSRRDDGRPWTEQVLLTVVLVSPTTLRVERAPEEMKALLDQLGAANLRASSAEAAAGLDAVEVAGEITAYVRIMADRERGRIALLCRNVARFGTTNFVVDAAKAEDALFEEFANYLLGQPSRFLQIAASART